MDKEDERFEGEKKEYQETDTYVEMQKQFEEKDTDDDFKIDRDPKGYELYMKVLKATNVFAEHLPFINKLVDSATTDARFLLKVVSTFKKTEELNLCGKALFKLYELREK